MKGWFGESYRHYLAAKKVLPGELQRWRKNVNMSPSELRKFMNDYGTTAGLSRREASAEGVKSGRDSARAIIRMKEKPVAQWNDGDITWMRRQNSFVARMRGARGPLYDGKGRPTRKLLALKVWGHDPEKRSSMAGKTVDLKRYAGTWKQESVKNEPWFQKGCKDVKAKYTLRKDGTVKVVNTCDGRKIQGVARSVSKDNRRLKVDFGFPFREGDYFIKDINKGYTRAVVKGGKTEWVLVR
jgi:lipocalin